MIPEAARTRSTGATALGSYRVADFADLTDALPDGNVVVLDVRQSSEYDDGHVRGAHNIPVHELTGRINELPSGDVWVHCATGYRASVAASLLDRAARKVVLINDEFANAEDLTTHRQDL